jgi:phospholipid/cholesterol/gamma-HCH transport system substrate-binding protein
MQKQAPSIGRIMVAVGFALSCFALLLFLWVTFGGPIPFKPESYRFTADFPEAITLSKEAEVRIGGVTVGHVKQLSLPPESECHADPTVCNTTRATIEIDPRYAPISQDARAILRQKTLLGETYVELTTGSKTTGSSGGTDTTSTTTTTSDTSATAAAGAIDVGQISGSDAPRAIPEGGHLNQTQVADQTQIDEIFNGFDQQTRDAFRLWQQNAALAIKGRGLDLNDAFGNLGPFASDASDVLGTLRQQEQSLRTVVHDTGDVFAALTAHDQDLAGAIVGANRTFRALASRDQALADTFKIFPTFENESRLTLDRLKSFSAEAGPVFHDLRPVARDLSPTLRDVRKLAPKLRTLFTNFDPLIKVSATGLPSLASFLRELRPVFVGLDPFLANFNPLLRYLDYQAPVVSDFLAGPSSSTADFLPFQAGQHGPLHLSRQMSLFTAETTSIYQTRIATNRGNGYLQPDAIGSPRASAQGEIFESHDCNNTANGFSNSTVQGGLGSGQVSHNPPSSPQQEPSGQFPLSSMIGPQAANWVGPHQFNPGTTPPPFGPDNQTSPNNGPSAFAACTIAPNWPSIFGGAKVPMILPDG